MQTFKEPYDFSVNIQMKHQSKNPQEFLIRVVGVIRITDNLTDLKNDYTNNYEV